MTITLWGRATSSNVQKVRWALAELGVHYEHIPLGGRFGGNREPSYLALNPNGLVPTLRDGELVIWESHAIVRYLAASRGAGSLWPEAPAARAVVDQWTDWTATTFQPAWIDVFWAKVRTPVDQQDPARIERSVAAANRCFGLLDRRLGESAFLGGDRLTYADIVAGVSLFRWTTMDIARDACPNVARWHAALHERAAFRDAVEVDYVELRGRVGP